MNAPIRVLLIDDHQVVRHGLRAFLEVQPDIEVVGEGGDGSDAIELTERLSPDVVLLDLQLPGIDGVSALRTMRERGLIHAGCAGGCSAGVDEACHLPKVLVLTSFTEPASVVPAMRAGASGYLFKDVEPTALAQAIRAVHAGQVLLEPEAAGALLAGEPESAGTPNLTDREREVLIELAHGRSNREIARSLVLAEKTVKSHVSSVLTKLGVADRTQAALWAVRHGLAPH